MADPIYQMLASSLQEMGLGALFTLDQAGNPGGWLWDQFQQGIDTPEELGFAIQNTDVFRAEFGVIVEQKRRAAAGEPVYVMSPAEVIEYRNGAKQLMSAAGMPSWFYDDKADFDKLMLTDQSLQELEGKITAGFDYMEAAPPEVRQAFTDYYGVQGPAALAAYILDPDRTVAQIEKATKVAYTGGMAKRYDIQLEQATAARIAELPMSEAGINEGLSQISSQQGIFAEGAFEAGPNLDASTTGVAAVFEADAAAQRQIARRGAQRQAVNKSSTGGAVLTQRGLTGASSAND